MRSDVPQITCATDGLRIGVGQFDWLFVRGSRMTIERHVEIGKAEPGHVEVVILIEQIVELGRQQALIPTCKFSDAIVCERERTSIGVGQKTRANTWDIDQLQDVGRMPATMPCDDQICIVNNDRNDKAEPFDAGGDLVQLLVAVHPRIARVGDQCTALKHLDAQVIGNLWAQHDTAPRKMEPTN